MSQTKTDRKAELTALNFRIAQEVFGWQLKRETPGRKGCAIWALPSGDETCTDGIGPGFATSDEYLGQLIGWFHQKGYVVVSCSSPEPRYRDWDTTGELFTACARVEKGRWQETAFAQTVQETLCLLALQVSETEKAAEVKREVEQTK